MLDQLPEPPDLNMILDHLERTGLESAVPSMATPLWGELEGIPFSRICGLSAYWQRKDLTGYGRLMEDVISGLNGQREDFYFIIFGQGNQLRIYTGAGTRISQPDLPSILTGAFPGICLDGDIETHLGRKLENDGFFRYRGRLTGIPSLFEQISPEKGGQSSGNSKDGGNVISTNSQYTSSLERLIRGLQSSSWGFFVHALPFRQDLIISELHALLNQMSKVQTQTRLQVQKLIQQMNKITEETQEGSTTSLSAERANRQAEYVLSRLELQLKRLQRARAEGYWKVDVHFFSPDESTLLRMQTMLRSVFHAGDDSVEPLRSFICQNTTPSGQDDFSSLLSTSEVARLAYLPREETPGYRLSDFTLFDVDQQKRDESEQVVLGTILEYGRDTKLPYSVPIELLSQHALISGVTGSGKTTTIKNLLISLYHHDPSIPFLVIEPTKAEYRGLLGDPPGTGPVPDLQIYTLGDETICPLRLNPFQFEIMDAENFTHVQTHIDYIKTVFSAAFVLYPPMPYVLEICLHEIYTDRGWDLTTSRNNRLPEQYWKNAQKWPIFPTFEDLYQKIDEVTDRLGYDSQIKMDIKAGLQTRIRSMMIGGKGLMLNSQLDKGIQPLLASPCVLELERIGDDELKVFLMGILLTRLFEYRRLQNEKRGGGLTFQHLTVIEEAHRLIRATPQQAGPDQANPRGQAVETFTNLLSEIRSYGEGIFIAEQIPTKLAADALKNTSLKIMHRLVAEDDRRMLQAMTNMDEAQSRYMVVMPRGQAVVFNQGDDHPLLIKVDLGFQTTLLPGNEDIRRPNKEDYGVEDVEKLLETFSDEIQKKSKLAVEKIVWDNDFRAAWRASHLRIWLPVLNINRITELVQKHVQRSLGDATDLTTAVLVRAVQAMSWSDSYNRGRLYDWNYEVIQTFHQERLQAFATLLSGQKGSFPVLVSHLTDSYKEKVKMSTGPFAGCQACREHCVYRFDLSILANDTALQQEWRYCLSGNVTGDDVYIRWVDASKQALQTYFDDDTLPAVPELVICLSVQGMAHLGLSGTSQRQMMDQLCAFL